MPALNYKKEIAAAYEAGKKIHTIRTRRKDGRNPRPGQTLYQYTGQRTKQCRMIGEDQCVAVRDIQIWFGGALVVVEIDGKRLIANDVELLARNDGFEDRFAMKRWFEESYRMKIAEYPDFLKPFCGLLIQWAETSY